jgi:hypothetical protein
MCRLAVQDVCLSVFQSHATLKLIAVFPTFRLLPHRCYQAHQKDAVRLLREIASEYVICSEVPFEEWEILYGNSFLPMVSLSGDLILPDEPENPSPQTVRGQINGLVIEQTFLRVSLIAQKAKSIGPKSVKNLIALLRMMWNQAKAWGYVQHDPFGSSVLPERDLLNERCLL